MLLYHHLNFSLHIIIESLISGKNGPDFDLKPQFGIDF